MLDLIKEFDIMTEKILIIDDDVDTLRLVGLMLHDRATRLAPPQMGSKVSRKRWKKNRTSFYSM